ncbi:glycosyltransferase family 9 protein [Dyella subtropica]|uniref:glycosyltransferase family 9 protein n=1 Tax=Dyella subtropica TaxID=2992127 RepID=UPI00225031DC|nr:glycosyltransferase family 9 protein [Dyella subtropica]
MVTSAVQSPVVIRFGRVGDTVMLQPLLHKLHLRYGAPCRLVAIGDWSRVLYEGNDDVAEVLNFQSQRGSLWFNPQRLRVALALRQMRTAPFYICEPDVRTRTKVRPMLALARVPLEHCVFIEDIPMQEGEHWVDWLLRFADQTPSAFADTPTLPAAQPLSPRLLPTANERADLQVWLREQGIGGHPLVLLQPANKRTMRWNGVRAANDDEKSWPVERWAGLARAILQWQPEARVVLCGSPAEAGYMETIRAAANHPHVVSPRGGLPLGHLRALMEVAHSMVSVDTGPAHLAAAVGCPLVVLFGNRWPCTWVPRSASGSPVAVLGGLPEISRVDQIDMDAVAQVWWRLSQQNAKVAAKAM